MVKNEKSHKEPISKSFQYVQGLWQNVISYTIRDALTAAINIIVVTFCFYNAGSIKGSHRICRPGLG